MSRLFTRTWNDDPSVSHLCDSDSLCLESVPEQNSSQSLAASGWRRFGIIFQRRPEQLQFLLLLWYAKVSAVCFFSVELVTSLRSFLLLAVSVLYLVGIFSRKISGDGYNQDLHDKLLGDIHYLSGSHCFVVYHWPDRLQTSLLQKKKEKQQRRQYPNSRYQIQASTGYR